MLFQLYDKALSYSFSSLIAHPVGVGIIGCHRCVFLSWKFRWKPCIHKASSSEYTELFHKRDRKNGNMINCGCEPVREGGGLIRSCQTKAAGVVAQEEPASLVFCVRLALVAATQAATPYQKAATGPVVDCENAFPDGVHS
jgi:hypothetical protein